ncbi:MAG: hypothetical protein RL117_1446 [Verrucomicrobiota bacterium]
MSTSKASWLEYVPDITRALPWLRGDHWGKRALRRLILSMTGLSRGGRCLQRAHMRQKEGDAVFGAIAAECELRLVAEGELPVGALVVVANHPTGPMDGISFGAWLCSQRDDVRILTSDVLSKIPCFHDRVIGLALYESSSAARQNALALKQAMRHLHAGGCLAVFPAGAAAWRRSDGVVREAEWSDVIFHLAVRCQAQLGLLRIDARNPMWLERLLAIHAHARTFFMGWCFLSARKKIHTLRWFGICQKSEQESVLEWKARCESLLRSGGEGVCPNR